MTFKKYISFRSKPDSTTFPALPEYMTYTRLILAAVYGVNLAMRKIEGGLGVVAGVLFLYFVPITYVEQFLAADVDSYKNLKAIALPNAIALLLLIWITLFTLWHGEDVLVQLNSDHLTAGVGAGDQGGLVGGVAEDVKSEF